MQPALFLFLPTLALAAQYTTYIGDAYPRTVTAITADAAGNTYVVGNRGNVGVLTGNLSIAIPTSVPLPTTAPPDDVFITKLDPTGKILFTNTFAGKGIDQGLAVAVDPTGNIYIAGTTTSPDFPISNALQSQPSQYGAGFIVKLSPDGRTILYSTYFGGVAGMTSINAMTTDAAGNLYLTGTTFATDFPHTAGMPTASVVQTGIEYTSQTTSAAFVAALDPAGDKILFAGSVGGTQNICNEIHDCMGTLVSTTGIAIALDSAKNVYFGGNTNTIDLPTTPRAFLQQGTGAFAGKITAGGTGLAYLTLLGSAAELASGPAETPANVLSSLTADSAGNAYLAGTTGDPKFPVTPGAYQTTFAGNPVGEFGIPSNTDGFVAKLKPDGSALVWASYLGGIANDGVNSIAVDPSGDVWAVGATASPNFPNVGWSNGDDFLVEFNPAGSALGYSARYPTGSISTAVAMDASLETHTAGATGVLAEIAAYAVLPIVPPATPPPDFAIFGVANAAGGSLAGRISPAEVITIYAPSILTGPGGVIAAATTLQNIKVTIGGFPAPLLSVLSDQITAVVPMEVTPQAAATIQINDVMAPFPVWVDQSDAFPFPGVLNQNGSLNSEANPAKSASIVSFYATGWQSNFAPLTDGQIATTANSACNFTTCYASQGTIVYAGAAPGIIAGVSQFNLQLNRVTSLQQLTSAIGGLNQPISVWITP